MTMTSTEACQRGKSYRLLSILLVSCLALGGCQRSGSDGGESAAFIRDGVALGEIVIAEQPARMTRLAARELQTYLEKITGAQVPIVDEPSVADIPRIYVGVSRFTGELGIETEELQYGAYRMVAGPGWLVLAGNDHDFEPVEPWGRSRDAGERQRMNAAWDEITGDTFWNPMHSLFAAYNPELDVWAHDDRGTLNAVHAYLHDLGVRWYFPGDLGEIVPRSKSVSLPQVDRTVRPDFPLRALRWFYDFQPTSTEDAMWRLRLGLHQGADITGLTQPVHGMKYVHRRDEFKQAHPEFFALMKGERQTGHKDAGAPCLASEGMLQKHVAYARHVFDHFGEPAISIDLVDGYSGIECEDEFCRSRLTPERGWDGRMSDYVWPYIDRVARELYESHPDRTVTGLAYGAYRLPPETIDKFSPNLAMIISPRRLSYYEEGSREDFEAVLAAWREKLPSGKIFTFDRFLHNWPRSPWAGIPVYKNHAIADSIRSLRGISLGESLECYEHRPADSFTWDPLAVAHLGIYLTSRLWWDADLDVDALFEEYLQNLYGPAKEQMRAFIQYAEANWHRMRGDLEAVETALTLLEEAKRAAPEGSAAAQRIALLDEYVGPLRHLRQQLGRVRENVPRVRAHQSPLVAAKKLDGKLDDAWRASPQLYLKDAIEGTPPPRNRQTEFRVFMAGNYLVFGFRCAEPDMAGLRARLAGASGAASGDTDFVEVLLETLTHSFYKLRIGPDGVLYEADCSGEENPAWSATADSAVFLGDDFWSAELRIPLAGEGARDNDPLTGVDGPRPSETYTWHFNVLRERARDGTVQLDSFVPAGAGDPRSPQRFAELWAK